MLVLRLSIQQLNTDEIQKTRKRGKGKVLILVENKIKWGFIFPTKIFFNYEEKNSNFTVKKLGHHLNQVIKVNIASDKTYQHHVP